MKSNIEELCKKYIDNPLEGMTCRDICNMREDELLDMDYFLNEDDLFADEAGYLLNSVVLFSSLPLCRLFSFRNLIKIELSYKVKQKVPVIINRHSYYPIIFYKLHLHQTAYIALLYIPEQILCPLPTSKRLIQISFDTAAD